MRNYTLSAGMMLAILAAPAAAQDATPPPMEESGAPAPAQEAAPTPPPQLTPDQQANFDGLSPDQQASYAAWPGDVQAYYWSLPIPRQDVFWRLTDNDKVSLARMEPVNRAKAWQLVEKRLQGRPAAEPKKPMQEKPDGS